MIDGVKVQMGGMEFVVPPLTINSFRKLQTELRNLQEFPGGLPNEEQFEAITKLVQAALARNYPEQTVESVGDLIDTSNMQAVLAAVMSVSGMKERQAGEAVSRS